MTHFTLFFKSFKEKVPSSLVELLRVIVFMVVLGGISGIMGEHPTVLENVIVLMLFEALIVLKHIARDAHEVLETVMAITDSDDDDEPPEPGARHEIPKSKAVRHLRLVSNED